MYLLWDALLLLSDILSGLLILVLGSLFLFVAVLLSYDSHNKQLTHLKCISQWFLEFSQGYVTIITIIFRTFFTKPKATTNLLFVFRSLPVLDISKCNHTTCCLLCLAYFP